MFLFCNYLTQILFEFSLVHFGDISKTILVIIALFISFAFEHLQFQKKLNEYPIQSTNDCLSSNNFRLCKYIWFMLIFRYEISIFFNKLVICSFQFKFTLKLLFYKCDRKINSLSIPPLSISIKSFANICI